MLLYMYVKNVQQFNIQLESSFVPRQQQQQVTVDSDKMVEVESQSNGSQVS